MPANPPLFLSADEIARLLPFPILIEAMVEGYRTPPEAPLRRRVDGADGQELIVMPAMAANSAGAKLLTVVPRNARSGRPVIQGLYILFDMATGAPAAILDAGELTGRRTAAGSAVAADRLARADAETLLLVGAGHLIPYMAEAFACVRPLRTVMVWARNPSKAAETIAEVATRLPSCRVAFADDLAVAVRNADIVSAATRATAPIIAGEWLRPGSHVDLVGGYRPDMREADDIAIARARLFVDDRAALSEAGDLIDPIRTGVIAETAILGDLSALSRRDTGWREPGDITMYKSVGTAAADLIAATLAWQRTIQSDATAVPA